MSILKWRLSQYTDYGCANYQCLNCYVGWDARTSPKYWKFCPYCGCKWEGELENGLKKWERFWNEMPWRHDYERKPLQNYIFVLQEKIWWDEGNYFRGDSWKEQNLPINYSGKYKNAQEAINHLNNCRKLARTEVNDGEIMQVIDQKLGFLVFDTSLFKIVRQYRLIKKTIESYRN